MAAVAVPLAVAGIGAASSAMGSKGGGSQGQVASWYSRTAGPIATDIRRALDLWQGRGTEGFQFDANGNLINSTYGTRTKTYESAFGPTVPTTGTESGQPISANEKALFEAMNFFGNLYNNKDINSAFDLYRGRMNVDPTTGLVSDPWFNIIRERGTAASMEAGARMGGLRDSGTARGVADFLTTAEAQQRQYEDERAAAAANQLFNMNFQRGQAGFIPSQTLSSVLASLGGSTTYGPTPQFNNSKGQGAELAGQGLSMWYNAKYGSK